MFQRQRQYQAPSTPKTRSEETLQMKLDGYLSLCTATPDETYLSNYHLNKTLLKALSQYCKQKGIRFMLVTLDIPSYVTEDEKKYKSADSTFNSYFLKMI